MSVQCFVTLIFSLFLEFFLNAQVEGYPVYSMATPTISGAKEMLTYLGSYSTTGSNFYEKVVIIDLREEAVVYINGTPFVLREIDQPVDTLKHVGITGPSVRNAIKNHHLISCA